MQEAKNSRVSFCFPVSLGVDIQGGSDEGLMFGYATRETPEMMPMPMILAHKL